MRVQRTIVEFYAPLLHADYSFLSMNKTLTKHRYEIGILPLDEVEIKFRELFDLPAYSGQRQEVPIKFANDKGGHSTIYVSREFARWLENDPKGSLIDNGYLVYLKKSKVWYGYKQGQLSEATLINEIDSMRAFISRLSDGLHLTRHGSFSVGELFAYIREENKLMLFRHLPVLASVPVSAHGFSESDNYSLRLFLDNERKASGFLELATQTFLKSFYVKNSNLRYLLLHMALEICFSVSGEEKESAIPRFVAILLAEDKSWLPILHDQMAGHCGDRERIVFGDLSGEEASGVEQGFREKADQLEEIVRAVLKKLIKINPVEKGVQFYGPRFRKT